MQSTGSAESGPAPVPLQRPAADRQGALGRQFQTEGQGANLGTVAGHLRRRGGRGVQVARHFVRHRLADDQCRGHLQVQRHFFSFHFSIHFSFHPPSCFSHFRPFSSNFFFFFAFLLCFYWRSRSSRRIHSATIGRPKKKKKDGKKEKKKWEPLCFFFYFFSFCFCRAKCFESFSDHLTVLLFQRSSTGAP